MKRLADFVKTQHDMITISEKRNYPSILKHQEKLIHAGKQYKHFTPADTEAWLLTLGTRYFEGQGYEPRYKNNKPVNAISYALLNILDSYNFSNVVDASIIEIPLSEYEDIVPEHAVNNLTKAVDLKVFDEYVVLDPLITPAERINFVPIGLDKQLIVDPILCGKVKPYKKIFFIIDAWVEDISPSKFLHTLIAKQPEEGVLLPNKL